MARPKRRRPAPRIRPGEELEQPPLCPGCGGTLLFGDGADSSGTCVRSLVVRHEGGQPVVIRSVGVDEEGRILMAFPPEWGRDEPYWWLAPEMLVLMPGLGGRCPPHPAAKALTPPP